MEQETSFTVVDQERGLIVESPDAIATDSSFLQLVYSTGGISTNCGMLIQDEALAGLPTEMQMNVVDLYNIEPLPFADVINQTLLVHGAAIWEVEPGLHKDGSFRERYFQGRILVDLDGKLRLIKTSGTSLLRHIVYMCKLNGWFLFQEPIKYKFVCRGAGKPHIMERAR